MKDIDQIFVMHGAFQDSNSNNIYDLDEEIGYSGKGGISRSDLSYEPGTEVVVKAVDSNGNSLSEGIIAVVNVAFIGKNSYLSYSFEKPVMNGMVAVPIPPEEYDATITINAKQAGGTQVSSKPVELTTKLIYDNIDSSKPLSTYSPVIDVEEISCEMNSQCIMWGYGDTCSNSKCTTTGNDVSSGGDACCSGFILLFSLFFLSFLKLTYF